MTNVYIDFERNNCGDIIEIGAVAVHCITKKVKEFHQIIRQPLRFSGQYILCAENSHCIPYSTLISAGIEEKKSKILFQYFINSLSLPITFLGHGDDTTEEYMTSHFPFLLTCYCSFLQVDLPQWHEREYEDYFLATYLMKSTSEMFSCSYKNHTIDYLPNKVKHNKPLTTNSQKAKYKFKFHCALFDAYLLAFFKRDITCYCCDEHFKDVFYFGETVNASDRVYKIDSLYPQYSINYDKKSDNDLYISHCGFYCNNLLFVDIPSDVPIMSPDTVF